MAQRRISMSEVDRARQTIAEAMDMAEAAHSSAEVLLDRLSGILFWLNGNANVSQRTGYLQANLKQRIRTSVTELAIQAKTLKDCGPTIVGTMRTLLEFDRSEFSSDEVRKAFVEASLATKREAVEMRDQIKRSECAIAQLQATCESTRGFCKIF